MKSSFSSTAESALASAPNEERTFRWILLEVQLSTEIGTSWPLSKPGCAAMITNAEVLDRSGLFFHAASLTTGQIAQPPIEHSFVDTKSARDRRRLCGSRVPAGRDVLGLSIGVTAHGFVAGLLVSTGHCLLGLAHPKFDVLQAAGRQNPRPNLLLGIRSLGVLRQIADIL